MRTPVITVFLALAVVANAGHASQVVDAFECALHINDTYNTLTSIAQDPSSIMDQWLDLKTEIYEVYKSCSFDEQYEWLEDPSFHIAPESLLSAQCISDFTQFGEDIANFIQNRSTDAEEYIQDFGILLDDVNKIYEDCQPENNEETEEEWEAEMETEEEDEKEEDDSPEVEEANELMIEIDLDEIELKIKYLDDDEAFQQAIKDLEQAVKDENFGDLSPGGVPTDPGTGSDPGSSDPGDDGDDDDDDFDDGDLLDDIMSDGAADAGIDAGVDAGIDAALDVGFDLLGFLFYGIKSLTGLVKN